MKRFVALLVMSLLSMGVVAAAVAHDTVENPKSCQQCGMDRVAFAYSRMVIVYADGTREGVCSLNCAVEQMKKHRAKRVKTLSVADYASRKLVDARTATWVIGGNKPGVMTAVPKWAFSKKEDAEKFVRENGGRVTTFDEAMNMSLKENE